MRRRMGRERRSRMRGLAWLGGVALLLLFAVGAGLYDGRGHGDVYKAGAVAGRIVVSLLIAWVLRWLWVRFVRRGRTAVSSPWLAVVAAVVALVSAAGAVGSERAHCAEQATASEIVGRLPGGDPL